MSQWVIKRGTREVRVPDEATLLQWARDKRFDASDLVFSPHTGAWVPARETAEIRHLFVPEAEASKLGSSPARPHVPPVDVHGLSQNATLWPYPLGKTSQVFGVIGGAVSILGGLMLLGLKAAGDNSLIEALAHGIGVYCVGKGIFMIAAMTSAREAATAIIEHLRR